MCTTHHFTKAVLRHDQNLIDTTLNILKTRGAGYISRNNLNLIKHDTTNYEKALCYNKDLRLLKVVIFKAFDDLNISDDLQNGIDVVAKIDEHWGQDT